MTVSVDPSFGRFRPPDLEDEIFQNWGLLLQKRLCSMAAYKWGLLLKKESARL